MTDSTPNEAFDLTHQPWLRVLFTDGRRGVLSLREVFHQSREILRIAGETPQQDAALLRLLLVILWRAHRRADERLSGWDPEGVIEWWVETFTGASPEASQAVVQRYLDETEDRWDLMHPTHPFMQVADLHTLKGEYSPVQKLVQDSESPYFSMRAAEGLDSLDLAEAARWLVHLQAWNYSGIKSGAVGDPRVKGGRGYPIGTGWTGRTGLVVVQGRNLAETFVLNTAPDVVFTDDAETDLPVWEREPDTAAPRGREHPTGPCDLLTWQSRRTRLHVAGGRVTGVLVANGDRIESQNTLADPMTAYRFSEPQSKKAGRDVWMPRQHNETRTLWRGIEPLFAHQADTSATVRAPATIIALRQVKDDLMDELRGRDVQVTVELVGTVYGTQDSSVTATLHESMPLRLAVLMEGDVRVAQSIITAAEGAMTAAVAVGQFSAMLRQAAGHEYAFDADATARLLAAFNEPFKEWLAGYHPEPEQAHEQRRHWFASVERMTLVQARTQLRGASPAALVGREDPDGRLHSAASAWSLLRRRLAEAIGTPELDARRANRMDRGDADGGV